MDKHYSQLTLKERKEIEAGLDRGDPFRGIASLIGRQPSTVSREVRENRSPGRVLVAALLPVPIALVPKSFSISAASLANGRFLQALSVL